MSEVEDPRGNLESAGTIGMFGINQQDYMQKSPAINFQNNLNYKHMTGMNASQYRQSQKVIMDQHRNPRDSGGTVSVGSH